MRLILKKIFVLIIVLLVSDFFVGKIMDYLLLKSPDGRYYKADYTLRKSTQDIIIFGSSRAETNFAPFVFKESFNLSCWNSGRGGQGLPFWYAMQQGILSRYTPKIAVVNLERDFLSVDLAESAYERAGFLRPFYNRHKEIRPVINKISQYEKFLLYSRIYAYNSSFYYLLRPYLLKGLDGDKNEMGWKTKKGEIQESKKELQEIMTDYELNLETVAFFNKFIRNFKENNCEVFLVFSPNFNLKVKETPTIEYITKMKDVHVLNHSADLEFINNHKLFKDLEHLNIEGAIKFSEKLSAEMRMISKKH